MSSWHLNKVLINHRGPWVDRVMNMISVVLGGKTALVSTDALGAVMVFLLISMVSTSMVGAISIWTGVVPPDGIVFVDGAGLSGMSRVDGLTSSAIFSIFHAGASIVQAVSTSHITCVTLRSIMAFWTFAGNGPDQDCTQYSSISRGLLSTSSTVIADVIQFVYARVVVAAVVIAIADCSLLAWFRWLGSILVFTRYFHGSLPHIVHSSMELETDIKMGIQCW